MWLPPGNDLSVCECDPTDVRLSAFLTPHLSGRNFHQQPDSTGETAPWCQDDDPTVPGGGEWG